jgi:hypothetical protein
MTSKSSVVAVPASIAFYYCHVELFAMDLLNCPAKVRLFACYQPVSQGNDSTAIASTSDLCSCIQLLIPGNSTVIFCGDFNLPSVDWSNIDFPSLSPTNTCADIFLNFFKHALNQFVLLPTRITFTSTSTLDLIMCTLN